MSAPSKSLCSVCGGASGGGVPYPGRRPAALPFEWIAICESCGTGKAQPDVAQDALDRYYASGAYWHAAGGYGQQAHERNQARIRVARVRGLLGRGGALKIADIGAGHGYIAAAFAEESLAVESYEFVEPDSAAAATVAAANMPFSIARRASLAELGGGKSMIFLNHVLEHVADPLALLGEVVSRLVAGGVAYVETPHLDFRFKEDVFPHVFFFTPASFRELARRLAVQTLALEIFGRPLAAKWTPTGFVQRVAARSLAMAARHQWSVAEGFFDRALWGYTPSADGMWLRWIFRR